MRPTLLALAPALAFASLATGPILPAPGSASAMRCSKPPLYAPKLEGTVYFTATATADTVTAPVPEALTFALEGAERRQRESGHGGAVDADPSVRGLVFDVDGVEAREPSLVAGHTRFVVVPWDYDASCRPLPWGGAAAFRPEGERAFLYGELRDSADWVDGLPTVDVHNPYMQRRLGQFVTPPAPSPVPDPDELLAFHRAMPWEGEVEDRGAAAIEAAVAWLDRHPGYADGPLEWPLVLLISAVNRADARAYSPPIVGTWRFDWTLPDGEVVTYWARTEVAPSGSESLRDYPWARSDDTLGARARVEARVPENGYRLWTWITFDGEHAAAPDPHPWHPGTADEVRERWTRSPYAGLPVEREDRAEAGPAGPLRVDVQVGELSMLLEDRPDLKALSEDHFTDFQARVAAGEVISPAGRMIRDGDGAWRLEAGWTLLDGRTIRLRAERINDLHFPRWR